MRVIIAGSRTINSTYLIGRATQQSGFSIDEVVSGGAEGVDTLGEKWAKQNRIPVKRFLADWEGHPERHITKNGHTYDPLAGHDRNALMADYADAAIVITNGSSGSKNMIEQMKSRGKPVRVLQRVPQDRNKEKQIATEVCCDEG